MWARPLLGDDLADNVKKAKAAHSMNQSISNKRLRLSSSSPRNPTSLYSSNSKASSSETSLELTSNILATMMCFLSGQRSQTLVSLLTDCMQLIIQGVFCISKFLKTSSPKSH